MFLRNYDNYWTLLNSCQFFASSSSSYSSSSTTTQFGDGYFNAKMPNGSLASVLFQYGYYSFSSSMTAFYSPLSLNSTSICLGTGAEPVSYDDYKLSGDVITLKLNQKSTSTQFNVETNSWRRALTCTCSNLTDSDVTINEWGIFKCNSSTSTMPAYSNTSSTVILMFREVLDTPITIKAGTTGTITFSIDIPMPNHP